MAERTEGFYAGAPWGGVVFISDLELEITSTSILHKPVNVVLAEESTQDARSRMKEPGAMTKSMMRRIFKE